jgi:hypothetical protein
MSGGNSTYGVCNFALSWFIQEGGTTDIALSNLGVVLAGTYRDDDPGNLWQVILYVDERANAIQKEALTEIFLGRAGGTPFRNYASSISVVYSLRSARIELSHVKNKEYIRVENIVSVRTDHPVQSDAGVSCGIPGHDQPGQEIVAEYFRVQDGPFDWNFVGRCGFAAKFSYKSD